MRLRTVYGAEYLRHFPDEPSVKLAKREWARQIGQHTRERIDQMFGHVKSERMRGNDDYKWLDIGLILATMGSSWEHAAQSKPVELIRQEIYGLPDLGKQERARKAGAQHLGDMRALFGISKESAQ